MTNTTYSYVGILVLALVAVILAISYRPESSYGSVAVSNEYVATTTAPNTLYGATVSTSRVVRSGQGSLGSVVITGANTGILNIYDATTSNASLRAPAMSSSTILIASFPASAAAGTYTFDTAYNNGLFIDITGSVATSTITYR